MTMAGWSPAFGQDGATQTIALSSTAAFELTGNYTLFGSPVLNASGTVAFLGEAGSNSAIYRTSDTGLVTIASTNASMPLKSSAPFIGGTFTGFSDPLLNDSGTVAFSGGNSEVMSNGLSESGIYSGTGDVLTPIAVTGQAGPGLGGNVTVFGAKTALSDTGRVAFVAIVSEGTNDTNTPTGLFVGSGGGTQTAMSATTIAGTTQTAPGLGGLFSSIESPLQNGVGASTFTGTSGTSGTLSGIYASFGNSLITIATSLQAAPGIGGNFVSLVGPTINDKGTAAFIGSSNTELIPGTGINRRGIFSGSGGALTAIATDGMTAPGFTGNFTNFFEPSISNSGSVAFRGQVSGGWGVYRWSPDTVPVLRDVATTLTAAPVIGGTFSKFEKLTMNDLGIIAFLGTSTAGTTKKGIYLGDGQELITAAYTGQSVAGSTIKTIAFVGGADRGGAAQLNNNGQIAYKATLADGTTTGILLFTPTLHFRTPASGMWAANSNWTVGILPSSVHDVVIDPAAALTVSGPVTRTTIKSLSVNGTGAGIAELALQSGGVITTTSGVATGAAGRVSGNGKMIGNFSNGGFISPGLSLSAGSLSVVGNVTLLPTSHLTLEIGGLTRKTGYDFLGVSGGFTLAGALDLSLLGGFAPQLGNSFDLFDATSISGAFSQINLPSLTSGLEWNTSLLATSGIISVINGGPVIAAWNLSGGGSWATAANWGGTVPNSTGAQANFGSSAANATVTLNGSKTVGAISFNSVFGYQVTGGAADAITLDNGTATPSISVLTGNHTLDAPLVLTHDTVINTGANTALTVSDNITGAEALTKSGTGILNLDGEQGYETLNANAGTTNVNGSFTGGTGTVNANATLNFSASQTLDGLNIGGGAALSLTGSTVVPEPGSLGLLALGAFGALTRRRRVAHGRAA